MQGLVRCALMVGLSAACSTSNPGQPDSGGGGGDDAQPTGSGLRVSWSTQPTIPGDAQDTITIKTAWFRVDNLRVIGDAGPGDPRTTKEDFELAWQQGQAPERVDFADAPIGLYSKVNVNLDGHVLEYSYSITGTVEINSVEKDFEIHDRNSLSANLDTSIMLEPGARANVPIKIDFAHAVDSVNFSALPEDDGTVTLDTLDPQMLVFRPKLTESFKVDTSGTN